MVLPLAFDDITSFAYLSFAVVNFCGFAMILGFFSGTGEMYAGIEPCIRKVAAEAFQPGDLGSDFNNKEMIWCLDQLNGYLLGNSAGHSFKLLAPVLFVAGFNMVLFFFFWYIRSIRMRFRYVCMPCVEKCGPSSLHADKLGNSAHAQDAHIDSQYCGTPAEQWAQKHGDATNEDGQYEQDSNEGWYQDSNGQWQQGGGHGYEENEISQGAC
jgi:hypothetical protein